MSYGFPTREQCDHWGLGVRGGAGRVQSEGTALWEAIWVPLSGELAGRVRALDA